VNQLERPPHDLIQERCLDPGSALQQPADLGQHWAGQQVSAGKRREELDALGVSPIARVEASSDRAGVEDGRYHAESLKRWRMRSRT
jgi:hypothetical protein